MSEWTDRLKFCTTGQSAGFSGGNLFIAGGDQAPNRYATNHVACSEGMRAAFNALYGSTDGPTRWSYIQSVVPWHWFYARAGHADENAAVEVRRSFGQSLSRTRGRWEFLWHSARVGVSTAWDGGTNLNSPDPYSVAEFSGYAETAGTGTSSLHWPRGNRGIESWPTPSATNPNVLTFVAAIDKEKIQNSDGYCVGCQARIIPRNPAVALNPSACRIIGAIGFDLYADRAGGLPGFPFVNLNALDGSSTRWVDIPADGQWHWIALVTGADLVPENDPIRPPYAGALGVSDYTGAWPYNAAAYGARTWAQIEGASAPIDMIAFHGEGGVVTPPPEPPPDPETPTFVHPNAATRPVWATQTSGGYKRWVAKNRAAAIAPTWTGAIALQTLAGQAVAQSVSAAGSPAPTYAKVSGPSWLSVSSAGALTGTVPAGISTYSVVISATNSAGTANETVSITAYEDTIPPTPPVEPGDVSSQWVRIARDSEVWVRVPRDT